jgi:hypothetical protein
MAIEAHFNLLEDEGIYESRIFYQYRVLMILLCRNFILLTHNNFMTMETTRKNKTGKNGNGPMQGILEIPI